MRLLVAFIIIGVFCTHDVCGMGQFPNPNKQLNCSNPSAPCLNGGICMNDDNAYHCLCPDPYQGRSCELLNPCLMSPPVCQNGATCNFLIKAHSCDCTEGWTGLDCSLKIDDWSANFYGHSCDDNPCGVGRCTIDNSAEGFVCECPKGVSGTFCDFDTFDECSSDPCKNGALCEDKVGDYECLCSPQTTGKDCDEIINPWANCTAATANCWDVFNDGICNEECNNEQCLYDGSDCELLKEPFQYVALGAIFIILANVIVLTILIVDQKYDNDNNNRRQSKKFAVNQLATRKVTHHLKQNIIACADKIDLFRNNMKAIPHTKQWFEQDKFISAQNDYSTKIDVEQLRNEEELVKIDAVCSPATIIAPPPYQEKEDVNARDSNGMTSLMSAIKSYDMDKRDGFTANYIRSIKSLLQQGADVNAVWHKTGETALHLVARYHHDAHVAFLLLNGGADVNFGDKLGRTPLHIAVGADAWAITKYLSCCRSVNVNARMLDGTTPLILGAGTATKEILDLLIRVGADVNATDNTGKTALHWAAASNHVDAVELLLKKKANCNAMDYKEETPLFLAAREDSLETCKVLLHNYANRKITDHVGRSPRDVAEERQNANIVGLFDELFPGRK